MWNAHRSSAVHHQMRPTALSTSTDCFLLLLPTAIWVKTKKVVGGILYFWSLMFPERCWGDFECGLIVGSEAAVGESQKLWVAKSRLGVNNKHLVVFKKVSNELYESSPKKWGRGGGSLVGKIDTTIEYLYLYDSALAVTCRTCKIFVFTI